MKNYNPYSLVTYDLVRDTKPYITLQGNSIQLWSPAGQQPGSAGNRQGEGAISSPGTASGSWQRHAYQSFPSPGFQIPHTIIIEPLLEFLS